MEVSRILNERILFFKQKTSLNFIFLQVVEGIEKYQWENVILKAEDVPLFYRFTGVGGVEKSQLCESLSFFCVLAQIDNQGSWF